MLTVGDGVESSNLLGREPDGNDLHGFGPTAGSAAPTTLQLLDVVAGLGLVGPLLDLLLGDHRKIV